MTRTKTYDLLDSHFAQENKNQYQNLHPYPKYRYCLEEYYIDPNNWSKYFDLLNNLSFNWGEFKFSSRPDLSSIINNKHPGVYIFYIKPLNMIYDLPKFVIYIGISNANNSKRPLINRLQDYYRLDQIKKRNALERLLVRFYDFTYVAYSTLDLKSEELNAIEKNLIGFFCPIANKDDYPIEISKAKKAFNRT